MKVSIALGFALARAISFTIKQRPNTIKNTFCQKKFSFPAETMQNNKVKR